MKRQFVARMAQFAVPCLFLSSLGEAKEYGNHDLKRVIPFAETSSGRTASIDLSYLDQILNDLSLHAKSYPTHFDTALDKMRAAQDVKALSGLLDYLLKGPWPTPNTGLRLELLLRAGFLNSIGHNLDIPGSAEKASMMFQNFLALSPSDSRANSLYGLFLAGAGKSKEALPYLEQAVAVGVIDAAYTLGLVHLSLGHKEKALECLEIYRQHKQDDERMPRLIEEIRNGRYEFKHSPLQAEDSAKSCVSVTKDC